MANLLVRSIGVTALCIGMGWILAVPTWATTPEIAYVLNCMGCHQRDGAGTPGKVPALKSHMGRFLQVPGGREFLVQVPGTAQSALSDADVAAVLNWMLYTFSRNEIPADFMPYTEAEVSRIRVPLTSVAPVRKQLLSAIEDARNE